MSRYRILVVDDDSVVAANRARQLTLCGHRVSLLAASEPATLVLATSLPELLLVDLSAPETLAWQTIKSLQLRARRKGRKLLILALIPTAEPALRDSAHAAGADLVVPNVVDGAYLCDLVQGLLDNRHADARPGDAVDRALFAGTGLH